MDLKPEDLERMGYVRMEKLEHMELIPFVRLYMGKWTRFGIIYTICNAIVFGAAGYFLVHYYKTGVFTMEDGLTHLFYGFAIAFLLVPVHEFIHVLAYKSQGALHTSYDTNLKKFYFLAVADKFVANKKEFQIVALAPIVVISSIFVVLLFFSGPLWTVTILGALLVHTAFCSGDFGMLSYFDFHKDKDIVTYDDRANKVSYFYGKEKESWYDS